MSASLPLIVCCLSSAEDLRNTKQLSTCREGEIKIWESSKSLNITAQHTLKASSDHCFMIERFISNIWIIL